MYYFENPYAGIDDLGQVLRGLVALARENGMVLLWNFLKKCRLVLHCRMV